MMADGLPEVSDAPLLPFQLELYGLQMLDRVRHKEMTVALELARELLTYCAVRRHKDLSLS